MSDQVTNTLKVNTRTLRGKVVSNSMEKTVVVAVSRTKSDPLYKKRYTVTKRYMAHNEGEILNVGDEVTIQASRPISRHKKWVVIK